MSWRNTIVISSSTVLIEGAKSQLLLSDFLQSLPSRKHLACAEKNAEEPRSVSSVKGQTKSYAVVRRDSHRKEKRKVTHRQRWQIFCHVSLNLSSNSSFSRAFLVEYHDLCGKDPSYEGASIYFLLKFEGLRMRIRIDPKGKKKDGQWKKWKLRWKIKRRCGIFCSMSMTTYHKQEWFGVLERQRSRPKDTCHSNHRF